MTPQYTPMKYRYYKHSVQNRKLFNYYSVRVVGMKREYCEFNRRLDRRNESDSRAKVNRRTRSGEKEERERERELNFNAGKG